MSYNTKIVLSDDNIATKTSLGVVKIGRGIDITADGVISTTTKVIVDAGITTDGELILIYSDGTELNAGNVRGPAGPPGPMGDSGEMPEASFGTTLVSDDYGCTDDDCYLGVNSSGSITITLPTYPGDGHQIAVKLEMPTLAEGQTITIETNDDSTIDGALSYTMTEPWQAVHLFSRGGHWFIV
jgi:hypothetical protein